MIDVIQPMLSICCTAIPLHRTELDTTTNPPIGICSRCKDNTTFEKYREEL